MDVFWRLAGESEPARKVSAAPPTGVDVLELGGLWNRLRPTRSLLDLAILDWGAAKESPDVLLILRACVTKSQANHYEPIITSQSKYTQYLTPKNVIGDLKDSLLQLRASFSGANLKLENSINNRKPWFDQVNWLNFQLMKKKPNRLCKPQSGLPNNDPSHHQSASVFGRHALRLEATPSVKGGKWTTHGRVEHGTVDVETFDGSFQLIDTGTGQRRPSVSDRLDFHVQFPFGFVICVQGWFQLSKPQVRFGPRIQVDANTLQWWLQVSSYYFWSTQLHFPASFLFL